jgi:hypothetical protein
MTETANLKATLRNEFRFQVRQNTSTQVPVFDGVAINVTDAFNGGGATNRSANDSRDFVLGNTTRWQASRNLTLTMAGEANIHKTHNDSRNNYLGTYQFASLHDYCVAEGFIGTQCQITQGYVEEAAALGIIPTFCVQPAQVSSMPTWTARTSQMAEAFQFLALPHRSESPLATPCSTYVRMSMRRTCRVNGD